MKVLPVKLWAYARLRDRAVSGRRPWVAAADCGETRTHRDRHGADRGSLRDRYRSATAANCQARGLPEERPTWRPSATRFEVAGCEARACNPSCNPVKLLRPSVYTMEPGSTFRFQEGD